MARRGERKWNTRMGKHTAIKKDKLRGRLLLGAVASGLAATALGGAGTADATCASISGVGNSVDCTSTPGSFAVGLGSGATANSNGPFDGAVAVGNGATALTNGSFDTALAGGIMPSPRGAPARLTLATLLSTSATTPCPTRVLSPETPATAPV